MYNSISNIHAEMLPKYTGRFPHILYGTFIGMLSSEGQPILTPTDFISDLYIGGYETYAFEKRLLQQTTTDYLEPLALGADENSVKKVVTTVDYEYGDLAGLPIKTTTTNSDGKQQIVKNYYPNQVTNVNSLSLQPTLTNEELTSISNLGAQNRVATPIQVESYEKLGENSEKMLSAQRNLYKDTIHTVLKSVSSSKNSSDFEERVVYHKYDERGNPLELSKADGTRVVYKWATNHRKPLAKIVNANYLNVQNAGSNDLRLSLPYAQVTTYTYTGGI